MTKHRIGLSDNWLRHVQDVAAKPAQCTAVQEAWERDQPLEVHGWIYDLKDGLIHDLHVSKSRP